MDRAAQIDKFIAIIRAVYERAPNLSLNLKLTIDRGRKRSVDELTLHNDGSITHENWIPEEGPISHCGMTVTTETAEQVAVIATR